MKRVQKEADFTRYKENDDTSIRTEGKDDVAMKEKMKQSINSKIGEDR